MSKKNDKAYIYAIQILFAFSISYGSQSIQFENMHKWIILVARFVSYMLIIKGTHEFTVLGYDVLDKKSKLEINKIFQQCKLYLIIFAASISILLYSNEKILGEDFLLLFMAFLITKYPEIESKKLTINYGEGMACSYFEGYLAHVIPSDGATFVGFEENINKFEAKQRTIFPVKRLFIIYTKSLYCPPDLKLFNKSNKDLPYLEAMQVSEEGKKLTLNYGIGMAFHYFEDYLAHILPSDGATFVGFEENISIFEAKQRTIFPVKRLFIIYTKSLYCPPHLKLFNKSNRDLPYLEAMQSLEEIEKDVAGVKNRTYKNAAYKIYRGNKTPVPLAAECATPLHTLHRVLQKKALYEELADVDPQELVEDFCSMLQNIIRKSPDCRDKCELVYYDDTDPTQNLAGILLAKIRELEPDFENIINRDI